MNWDQCIWYLVDLNQNGFGDACELQLAERFAPVLATNPSDITTREPAWTFAANPSSKTVFIFYAISYHFDLGCAASIVVCAAVGGMGGTSHYGDSEWIILHLEPYSPTSSHWRVVSASLSAHWNTWGDQSKTVYRNDLFWADNYAGRPLIWASKWKHANYKSKGSCDGRPHDTCSGNVREPFPLEVLPNRSLGLSWGRTLLDCRMSEMPELWGEECYWTANKFRGWNGLSPDAGGYKHALEYFNF